jgi:hypothetical protein
VNKRKDRRNSEVGGAFLIGLAASGDMPYKPCKRRTPSAAPREMLPYVAQHTAILVLFFIPFIRDPCP